MSRAQVACALIIAILFATCARAQDHGQPAARPPVGGVVSPEGAMIFYAAHGRDEACGVNCSEWVAAEGAVQWDTYKRLFAFFDHFGAHKMPVVLNVWGEGDLKAAMALGRIIRQDGLDTGAAKTVVAGCAKVSDADCYALKRGGVPLDARLDTSFVECDIVCVVVLAGGVHRTLPADANIVISGMQIKNRLTSHVSPEVSENLRNYYDDLLGRYLSQMGVNPQIVDIMERDSATRRTTTLSNNDWLKLGLVTGLAL